MDTILLFLLLVAIAAGGAALWWLRGRIQRIEEQLQGFAPLSLVPDRLHALGRTLEKLDPERVRLELEQLRAQLKRVESLVAVPPSKVEPPDESAPPRATVMRALVTRDLMARDYHSVVILHEDHELEGQALKLRVEAMRNGLRVVGTVHVIGDELREVRLEPSYTMFP